MHPHTHLYTHTPAPLLCLPVILIILQLFAHNSLRLLPKNNRKFQHGLKSEQRVGNFSYSSSDLGGKATEAPGETQVKSEGKSCGKRAERINSKFCCANMGNCANIERKYPAAFDAPV